MGENAGEICKQSSYLLERLFKVYQYNIIKLDYSYERKDQKILLQTTEKESWFILRTHGEDVDKIEGGESTKLEENAYLIKVQDTTVLIELKGKELHYYDE